VEHGGADVIAEEITARAAAGEALALATLARYEERKSSAPAVWSGKG